MNNTPYELLLEKIINMIYGEYDPDKITLEQQQQYISTFKERLVKWKIDPVFRKFLGPLQPPKILSKMMKVPVEEIVQIAKDLNINLPESANMSEFNIEDIPEEQVVELLEALEDNEIETEQNILEILAAIEREKNPERFMPDSFEYIDMSEKDVSFKNLEDDESVPNSIYMIKYLESLIDKIKRGEICTISIISLLRDGKASIYLPPDMTKSIELYNPIIELLKQHGSETNIN